MIANEKQYYITKRHLADFQKNLTDLESQEGKEQDILSLMHINSLKAKIDDFKKEIEEYEALKNGQINQINIPVDKLAEALIKGRIAKGWSQRDLANQLKMKEQQLQRYEACGYSTISLTLLRSIADAIGLTFSDVKVKMKDEQIVVSGMNYEKLVGAQKKIMERKALMNY